MKIGIVNNSTNFLFNKLKISGGTLKIYGDAICPDVPYKTLLLSVYDTAIQVVRETLNKYGLESENELDYSLVQV